MTNDRERMLELGRKSTELRQARAQLRRDLRSGAASLEDVFAERPWYVHDLCVFDVLAMLRDRSDATVWRRNIGRLMIRDGVNLHVTVRDASTRTLCWASRHGQSHVHYARRRRAVAA